MQICAARTSTALLRSRVVSHASPFSSIAPKKSSKSNAQIDTKKKGHENKILKPTKTNNKTDTSEKITTIQTNPRHKQNNNIQESLSKTKLTLKNNKEPIKTTVQITNDKNSKDMETNNKRNNTRERFAVHSNTKIHEITDTKTKEIETNKIKSFMEIAAKQLGISKNELQNYMNSELKSMGEGDEGDQMEEEEGEGWDVEQDRETRGTEGEEGEIGEEGEEGDEGEEGEEENDELAPSPDDTPSQAREKSLLRAYARAGVPPPGAPPPEAEVKKEELMKMRKDRVPNRFARQIELARNSEIASLIFEKAKIANMDNIHVYTQMIKKLAKDGQTVRAQRLVEEMRNSKDEGNRPTYHTYNSLILLYAKSGQLKKVLEVFQMMKMDGLQPNSRTYNLLILSFVKHGLLDKAVDALRAMKGGQARRKQATYSAVSHLVLASLVRYQNGEAQEFDLPYLVRRFAEKDVNIDRVFVLDGLLRAGKQQEAIFFVQVALRLGYTFFKSNEEFHSLISSFAESAKPTRALEIFDVLRKGGVPANEIPFNFLLKRFIQVGKEMIAAVYLKKLGELGYPVDAESYNIVLQSYRKNEKWEEAFQLINDMIAKKVAPNVQTYTIMIDIYGEKREADKVIETFNLITAKGLNPNLLSYALTIKALKKCNKQSTAANYLIEMDKAGHNVSIQAAEALVQTLNPEEDEDQIVAVQKIILKERRRLSSPPSPSSSSPSSLPYPSRSSPSSSPSPSSPYSFKSSPAPPLAKQKKSASTTPPTPLSSPSPLFSHSPPSPSPLFSHSPPSLSPPASPPPSPSSTLPSSSPISTSKNPQPSPTPPKARQNLRKKR